MKIRYLAGQAVQRGPVKRPLQFQRLQAAFRYPGVPVIMSDALRNVGTACLIASGYLALFAQDNEHAHRLLWIAVLSLNGVMALIGAIHLKGDLE